MNADQTAQVAALTANQRVTFAYYANNGASFEDALRIAQTMGK